MKLNHSQYKAVQGYESGALCSCGRPARHANGKCWPCFNHTSPDYIVQEKRLAEERDRLGIDKREGETPHERAERCIQILIEMGGVGALLAKRKRLSEGTK